MARGQRSSPKEDPEQVKAEVEAAEAAAQAAEAEQAAAVAQAQKDELAEMRERLAAAESQLEQAKQAPPQQEEGAPEPMPEPTVSDRTPDEGKIPTGKRNAVHTHIQTVRTKRGAVKMYEMKWKHPTSGNVHTSRYSE